MHSTQLVYAHIEDASSLRCDMMMTKNAFSENKAKCYTLLTGDTSKLKLMKQTDKNHRFCWNFD